MVSGEKLEKLATLSWCLTQRLSHNNALQPMPKSDVLWLKRWLAVKTNHVFSISITND